MGWLRLDLLRLLLLAAPAFLVNWWLTGTATSFAEAPTRAATILVPLLALTLGLGGLLRRDGAVTLGHGFLAFFLVFCLAFSLLTSTDPLIGRRTLQWQEQDGSGFATGDIRLGDSGRLAFLQLNRLGDWHYAFAPPAPPTDDLLVITLAPPDGELRGEARRRFAFLVQQALEHGAKGVAFDFYLERETPVDAFLSGLLGRAADAGVPVLFGYRPTPEDDGSLGRMPPPETLRGALPAERLGHLAGYREADGRLRMVPLLLPSDVPMRSLSHQIAESLHGGEIGPLPTHGMLQFVPPRWGVPAAQFSPQLDWGRLRGRFVLVGTESAHDLRQTPFGPTRGVAIHAYAAHGLRSGHFVRRLPGPWIFALLFAGSYWLALLHARGVARHRLVMTAAAASLAVVALAVAAMRLSLLWINVSYPLSAFWLLTATLLAVRAHRRRRAATPTTVEATDEKRRPGEPEWAPSLGAPPVESAGDFDVFLSHNSRDKPAVRDLARALAERGLAPWLDERELVPGRDWQADLERIIRTVRSAAVLVGPEGLGPWEVPELRACLSEGVRRGLPVIPVLLPGAPRQPVLPLFLTQFTWVDLRDGVTAPGLDRLEWGITGTRPRRRRAA